MRNLVLVCALSLSAAALQATGAWAQAGSPTSDLLDRATRASPAMLAGTMLPSALNQLSRTSRDWIKSEGLRQAQAPRSPDEVSQAINETMTADLIRIAKTQGVGPQNVSDAILLLVLVNAEDSAEKALKKARKTPVSNDGDQAAQALFEKAQANRKAVMKTLPQETMELLM